jgi:hypothetical protein
MDFYATEQPLVWNELARLTGRGKGTREASRQNFGLDSVFLLYGAIALRNGSQLGNYILSFDPSSLSFVPIYGPYQYAVQICSRVGSAKGPVTPKLRTKYHSASLFVQEKGGTATGAIFDVSIPKISEDVPLHPELFKVIREFSEQYPRGQLSWTVNGSHPTWFVGIAENVQPHPEFPKIKDSSSLLSRKESRKVCNQERVCFLDVFNSETGARIRVPVIQKWKYGGTEPGRGFSWVAQDLPINPWFSEDGKQMYIWSRKSAEKFYAQEKCDPEFFLSELTYSLEFLDCMRDFQVQIIEKKEEANSEDNDAELYEKSETLVNSSVPVGHFWDQNWENILLKTREGEPTRKENPNPFGILTFELSDLDRPPIFSECHVDPALKTKLRKFPADPGYTSRNYYPTVHRLSDPDILKIFEKFSRTGGERLQKIGRCTGYHLGNLKYVLQEEMPDLLLVQAEEWTGMEVKERMFVVDFSSQRVVASISGLEGMTINSVWVMYVDEKDAPIMEELVEDTEEKEEGLCCVM